MNHQAADSTGESETRAGQVEITEGYQLIKSDPISKARSISKNKKTIALSSVIER
jgi:hypothetical protein